MPKLIRPISAPQRRGKDYKKYMCHPTVLKSMINVLKQMPYITTQDKTNFQVQLFKILFVLFDWYNSNGEDPSLYLLKNLFNYLGGVGTFYSKSEIQIYDYNTPQARSFYSSYPYLNKKVMNSGIHIIPVKLIPEDVFSRRDHQNLLILDFNNKVAWRIEPNNGPKWDGFAKYVNPVFASIAKDFNLSFKGNYTGTCPRWVSLLPTWIVKHINLEKTSNYLPHAGLCMFISIGRYIYGNDLTDEILIKFIISFIKTETKNICGK